MPSTQTKTDSIAIIGAGPAGLAAAYQLTKQGFRVELFEASENVGGMARSFELWGQTVDLGPHRFFSADARVNRLWLEVVGKQYRMVDRFTRIYYNGKLFDYPLRANDVFAKLGSFETIRCVCSYLVQRIRPQRTHSSFEDWTKSRFGDRLYRIFFKGYSEKLWGIPCSDLDSDFAAQRIKGLSLFEAARNALSRQKSSRHPTLIDRFAYPFSGTGSVYQAMAEAICKQGGQLHFQSPVCRLTPGKDKEFELELTSGQRRHFRHIVSSMPITHLVRALPAVPERVKRATAALRFRNTILVYLRVNSSALFPDQWVYVHSLSLKTGRITNYRNWVPELYRDQSESILSLELWCDPGDALWLQSDQKHIAQATQDLRATGLINDAKITASRVVRVPNCYPVYDLGYRKHMAVVQEFLQAIPALHVIGRGGAFKYNNQDHSLLMGILAAENIALGKEHNIWSVNSDSSYQEEAIIDETGLVPCAQ